MFIVLCSYASIMSYSNLKKALQLFEEPVSNKEYLIKKTSKKSISKSQRAKDLFKVPIYIKSDGGKSILKTKEQIIKEKELNLVQLNLERLNKFDKTSSVNNIASNVIKNRLLKSPETSKLKKEESTVFTDEDFEKFEREYFQN